MARSVTIPVVRGDLEGFDYDNEKRITALRFRSRDGGYGMLYQVRISYPPEEIPNIFERPLIVPQPNRPEIIFERIIE